MSRHRKRPDPGRVLTRRGLVLLGLKAGVMGVLGWRMRQLQVEQADRYRLLADENAVNHRLIPPARGLIFDRDGRQIAINRQNYQVVMVREQARDPEMVLRRLAQIIPLSEERIERVLREMRQRSAFVPVAVTEHLEWEHIARVAANAPALPGVIPEVGLSRYYPESDAYAHVVGYVGPVSDYDLGKIEERGETPAPLLLIPKFQIGKSGVEQRAEQMLRGEAGTSEIEVNATGRVMRELRRTEGVPGADLRLTVKTDIQTFALERMGDESAATVVMDIETGDLLAMASAPSFDPNKFVFGISVADYRALNEDTHRPLFNKAVTGQYPPGSTFKMVVALAALEAGVADLGETVYCPGFMELGNRRFHCWSRGGHGHVDLHNSLKRSCDVYYYEMARRVGIERIAEMSHRLGLGESHDIPIPAVRSGLIPTKDWKEARHETAWLVGDSLNAGIGQGYVLATPLQLAVMTARIASGRAVVPRLIRAVDDAAQPVPEAPDLGVSAAALNAVRRGMFAVSNDRRGTAWRSRIAERSMAMAGKTGTSQVRNITAEERARGVFRNSDLPWERRDHALFVAFAPYDAPRYAIAVIVEHGGGGSTAAAPIARDVMMRTLWGPEPPLAAYPAGERDAIRRAREAAPDETHPAGDRA